MNKIIQFIDDISGVTKKELRDLFARITTEEDQLNGKYEKVISLPVYDDFYTTSNDTCPLYTSTEDRRLLFIECFPHYYQDIAFFRGLQKELECFNFRRAFFDYLVQRDIGDFNPIDQTLFSKEKIQMKSLSLKSSLQFFVDVFCEDDWIYKYNYGKSTD